METESFAWYITEQLAPTLRPGQIVVLDNLSVHKAERVRQAIAACHCQLLFLPPLYRRAVVERERIGWRDARVVRKATDPFRHDRFGELLLLTSRVSR